MKTRVEKYMRQRSDNDKRLAAVQQSLRDWQAKHFEYRHPEKILDALRMNVAFDHMRDNDVPATMADGAL